MKRVGGRTGQSIVEYLVVIAVLVVAFATYAGSLQSGVEKVGAHSETALDNAGNAIAGIAIIDR